MMAKVLNIVLGLATLSILYPAIQLATIKRAEIPDGLLQYVAQKHYGNDLLFPLKGKVAVVTGSTSGVGKGAASELLKLGATVIIASRSQRKCEDTVLELRDYVRESGGLAVPMSLDVSDLDDVSRFANWFKEHYNHLDILINNAGISGRTSDSMVSKQGYDILFATNYLGHFLLTELLLPTLRSTPKARVVQVSSTAQYLSDGEDLKPVPMTTDSVHRSDWPLAARARDDSRHRERSYPNSKLAQVLHSLALQDRITQLNEQDGLASDLKILSVSPGLTNTAIIPMNTGWGLLRDCFYSIEAGALSALYGALSHKLQGGEFLENVPHFMATPAGFDFAKKHQKMGKMVKDVLFLIGLPSKLIQQHKEFGPMYVQDPNPVATVNPELRDALYNWSRQELAQYI